ncbi:P-loop NTPase fold protein [Mucilaginibacter sp. AW1-7]|uniref:KAP family P-loop NTPase fold protein n=1 Tax=Mucilaginibacter sp. AW1-7 TaxID=3349874 RepID=UPI003F73DF04
MAAIDTDQPKISAEQDRFKRYDFAKRIAGIIQHSQLNQSLVVGLYGKWGEGKTSVMNFIKAELPKETVIVNFNPWLFSDQEQLIKSFLTSVAFELGETLSSDKEKIGKALKEYGEVIGSVTKYLGVPLDGFKQIGEKLQEVSAEKLKSRVDEMIRDTGKRLVICVDDIDRLDVKEIQYIFKLVKLVGDFPNSCYILAFDDELIATALAPQYGNMHQKHGYQFLEKIIQLPLKIPKATRKALKKYTIDMLDQVLKELKVQFKQKEVSKFRDVFDEHFLPYIDNPRLATRYANAVHFALPMLLGEVNPADLMLVEGLKILFPASYDFTRHHSAFLLADSLNESHRSFYKGNTKEQALQVINGFLTSQPEKDREAVKSIWQALFPQYRYMTGKHGYTNDSLMKWYKEMRVCSGKYFDRYFTYAVQEDEISDVQFEQFLTVLETEATGDSLEGFFLTNDVADVVFKLRIWEKDFSVSQSKNLSLLIARQSRDLPVEAGAFSLFTTQAEGAKIVTQLIHNLPSDERASHTKLIFTEAKDFPFVMEVVYRLFYTSGKPSFDILSTDEQTAMKSFLVERFQSLFTGHNFFEILPDTEAWRILSWWKELDPAGLQKDIESVLNDDVGNAIRLIKVFTPTITSWGGSETKTFKSDFGKLSYDNLAKSIDVKQIYQHLTADQDFERIEFDLANLPDRDPLSDVALASIFMLFYEQENSIPNL